MYNIYSSRRLLIMTPDFICESLLTCCKGFGHLGVVNDLITAADIGTGIREGIAEDCGTIGYRAAGYHTSANPILVTIFIIVNLIRSFVCLIFSQRICKRSVCGAVESSGNINHCPGDDVIPLVVLRSIS